MAKTREELQALRQEQIDQWETKRATGEGLIQELTRLENEMDKHAILIKQYDNELALLDKS